MQHAQKSIETSENPRLFVRHPAVCGGWTLDLDFGVMEMEMESGVWVLVGCDLRCYDCDSGGV